MKILSQDRKNIEEFRNNCWITIYGEIGFMIVHNGYICSHLGLYKDEPRAMEVLAEIFKHYKDGKKSYVMPNE